MIWPLLMFVLLRVRRSKHPELFDGRMALAAIEGALAEDNEHNANPAWRRTVANNPTA